MSQIGKAICLMAWVSWVRWGLAPLSLAVARTMRRQALGLATASLHLRRWPPGAHAVIVLGAIWLLNDYRGVPTPVLMLAFLLLAGMFMATRTAFGRRIYAIGGNLEAARLSGINVERTKLAVFAINGLMVAIAGLILSSRLGAGFALGGQHRRAGRYRRLRYRRHQPRRRDRQRRGRGHGGIYHVVAG
jgi:D-xylose transport system permease protein